MAPLAGVVFLYLLYKKISIKGLFVFLGAFSIPILYMLIWIINFGMLKEFIYWTFVFNFSVYTSMAQKLPTVNQLLRTLFVFGPAFLYIILSCRHAKDLKNTVKNDDSWILLSIFLLLGLLIVTSRFEYVHLQPTIPFAIFLSVLFFNWLMRYGNLSRVFFVVYSIVSLLWFGTFYKYNIGTKVYFFDDETKSIAKTINLLTSPTDKILTVGAQPIIYTLSDRLPAGNAFTVFVPWNLTVGENQILQGLESEMPRIVVRNSSSNIDGVNVVSFSPYINAFIDQNYKLVTMVGDNEILIKSSIKNENSN